MFGFEILEVAIGLVFFYLYASLICSAVRELIESLFKSKAKYLEKSVRELLDDDRPNEQSIVVKFFKHPLIDSLYHGDYKVIASKSPSSFFGEASYHFRSFFRNRNLPSYIPAAHFASALLDVIAPANSTGSKEARAKAIRAAATNADSRPTSGSGQENLIVNDQLKTLILWALDNSNDDFDKTHKALETWYDNSMDRVSSWYKRQTQSILLIVGFVAALAFNLDSVRIAQRLYDDNFRKAIVEKAIGVTKDISWRDAHALGKQSDAKAAPIAFDSKPAKSVNAAVATALPASPQAPQVSGAPISPKASGEGKPPILLQKSVEMRRDQ